MSQPYRTYRGGILQRLGLLKPPAELSGDPEFPIWMNPIEFAQLQAAVLTLAPKRIVEWGSGGSTKGWLDLVPELEALVSVEHHGPWNEKVKRVIQDPRVTLGLCPPANETPEPTFPPVSSKQRVTYRAWVQRCETDEMVLADYVAYPASVSEGKPFDLALVDGRARVYCAAEAMRILRPGGLLVIHDAQREEYHQAFAALGSPVYLDPWVQGQLCLIRKPG